MEEEAHEFFHTSDHFTVDDLLVDFSNDDDEENNVIADSTGANTTTAVAVNSSNSSSTSDLYVPSDELEWLSNFVEDSFSTEHVQKLQLISGYKTQPDPRSDAAACNWASSGLPKEAFYDDPFTGETTISSLYLSPPSSPTHTAQLWIKEALEASRRRRDSTPDSGGDERRCLRCATDKTPQWRTGPMGPKTLCNACGVRYKSRRLVPEYRPVASPTFMLTEHSGVRGR